MTLTDLKSRIDQLSYTVKANKDLLDKTRAQVLECENLLKVYEQANVVLRDIGNKKKQATIVVFEKVISAALKEVFNSTYEFKINISDDKRAKTEFKLVNGDKEIDIMTGSGGGIINVISFVLQVLILNTARPKRRKILFLDERFSNISPEYVPNMAKLLKSLAEQLDMQFTLVSHDPVFQDAADSLYELIQTPAGVTAKKLV
jgi:DNA repair exonuclease SbcCD ATPase subunit